MPDSHRLQAILAADAVGYSRLIGIDDTGTVAALQSAREVFRSICPRHGGRIVDTAGDSILAAFETATGAVQAARAIQWTLEEQNAHQDESRRLSFRIGIHLGDVIVQPDGTVYGDGVNVAARLQALAAPGSVYVSEAVRIAVRPEVASALQDAGEHQVKNIERPVRAFRVNPSMRVPEDADSTGMGEERHPTAFAARPAIAVLPFDNMSSDAEQAFFADGVAEDILTRLAMWRWLPVIARNSSFAFRGRKMDLKEVGKELGARYILEGSVRRAGERVRITAQLIEAETGHHLWAERYDRVLQDIFELQDEVVFAIVAALEPVIGAAERSRVLKAPRPTLDAWELYHRGLAHSLDLTREGLHDCLPLLRASAAADVTFAPPLSAIAMARLLAGMFGWEDPLTALNEAREASAAALRRDAREPLALAVSAVIAAQVRQYELALATARQAVECNPSGSAEHYSLGWNLLHQGDFAAAIEELQSALRLSPQDRMRPAMLSTLSAAHLLCGNYEEAHKVAAMGVHESPHYPLLQRSLASVCGMLGRAEEGSRALSAFLTMSPAYSMEVARQTTPFRSPEHFERYMEGLRRLGWQS